MSDILIEDYRGYPIKFSPSNESFYTDIDGSKWSVKQSFAAVKKWIDEHIKDNYKFEQFKVVKIGNMFGNVDKLTIISIRKDGRFVGQKENGEKEQISDYNEKDYILDLPENDIHFANIAIFRAEIEAWQNKIKAEEKLINAITLESVKSKYIQP